MRPGVQVDHTMIFEGAQGSGKTSAVRALGGHWYKESPIDLHDAKEAAEQIRGAWLVGFDELEGLTRYDVRRVKQFITCCSDHYRPAYGARARTFLRQCVFIGTTNESRYLTDATGGRRFWPVACGTIDVASIVRDRDQLWAESVALFDAGEPWHITDDKIASEVVAEQAARFVDDPWTERIREWVVAATATPKYPKGVTTAEVLEYGLRIQPSDHTRAYAMRVGEILSHLDYTSKQQREQDGSRARRYTKAKLSQPTMDDGGSDGGRDIERGKNEPPSQVTTCHNLHTHVREEDPPEHSPEIRDPSCDVGTVVTGDDSFGAWVNAQGIERP